MITGGVAARHPRLRIAFSHGGGAMAMLLPRLVHAWQAMPQAKAALAESPAATARRFYYDHLVFDAPALRLLIERFGASQILVGSDYPFAMGEPDPVGALERLGLDHDSHFAISAGNARRFLALK
jgi:aminocarboxymuconate-semialdehyde decarboxylase